MPFAIDDAMADMGNFYRNLQRCASGCDGIKFVADITSFPRQELMVLLRLLRLLAGSPVQLLFSEPHQYGTEKPKGWLTRGVKSVQSVPGFGGIQPHGKKKLLLMLLGHERERAAITFKRHQPDRTIVAFTESKRHPEWVEIARQQHLGLAAEAGVEVYPYALNPRRVAMITELVSAVAKKFDETHYLVVAPLSTKFHTVGVLLAAEKDRRIQITYAVPSLYNYKKYSSGTGRLWTVDV